MKPSEQLEGKSFELYFEDVDVDSVERRLRSADVRFVHPVIEQPWGQRVLRVYDPDGHIIEVGEPMSQVVLRLHAQGRSAGEIADKTFLPVERVRAIVGSGSVQG